MAYKLIKILFVLLFIPAPCFAVLAITDVSGTVDHGETVVITGTDFTAKATAAPIRWENNESYTVTNEVGSESSGYWVDVAASNRMVVSNEQNRSGNSTKEWKSVIKYDSENQDGGSAWCSIYTDNVGFASTSKVLVSFWIYWDSGTYAISWDEVWFQLKGFRLADYPPTSYPGTDLTNHIYLDGDVFDYAKWFNTVYDGDNAWSRYFTDDTPADGKWYHFTMVAYQGTQGNSDCDVYLYTSNTDFGSPYQATVDEDKLCWESAPNCNDGGASGCLEWDIATFHEYITSIETTNQVVDVTRYYDDIYIDNVWNRVEIGDAAVYANCNHREIQIPSAWSTTEITVTINQGSFGDVGAYLFVVDSDNNASAGEAITFGQGDTAPKAIRVK